MKKIGRKIWHILKICFILIANFFLLLWPSSTKPKLKPKEDVKQSDLNSLSKTKKVVSSSISHASVGETTKTLQKKSLDEELEALFIISANELKLWKSTSDPLKKPILKEMKKKIKEGTIRKEQFKEEMMTMLKEATTIKEERKTMLKEATLPKEVVLEETKKEIQPEISVVHEPLPIKESKKDSVSSAKPIKKEDAPLFTDPISFVLPAVVAKQVLTPASGPSLEKSEPLENINQSVEEKNVTSSSLKQEINIPSLKETEGLKEQRTTDIPENEFGSESNLQPEKEEVKQEKMLFSSPEIPVVSNQKEEETLQQQPKEKQKEPEKVKQEEKTIVSATEEVLSHDEKKQFTEVMQIQDLALQTELNEEILQQLPSNDFAKETKIMKKHLRKSTSLMINPFFAPLGFIRNKFFLAFATSLFVSRHLDFVDHLLKRQPVTYSKVELKNLLKGKDALESAIFQTEQNIQKLDQIEQQALLKYPELQQDEEFLLLCDQARLNLYKSVQKLYQRENILYRHYNQAYRRILKRKVKRG